MGKMFITFGLQVVSCSFLVLINVAYPSQVMLYPLKYILHIPFFFLFFSSRLSIKSFQYSFVLSTRAAFSAHFFLLVLIIRKLFVEEMFQGFLSYEICCRLQVLRVSLLQIYSSAPLFVTPSTFPLPLISCSKYFNLYIFRSN
jgi:hypothetical protein